MAYLVLVRHGKSEWNEKGLWTGWTDVDLNEEGQSDARSMAKLLKDIPLHSAHTSKLKRAQQTLDIIKRDLELSGIPTFENEALNERHYGIYTGKNKWEVKDQVGEEEFQKIRRSWDHPIPEGENMKAVHSRVVLYYEEQILEELGKGKNVIVAAHGNSLRALVKELENLSEEELSGLEVGLGEVRIYQINENGEVISKEIRGENPDKGKV